MNLPHEYKMPTPVHLPTPDLTRGKTNPAIMAPITLPRPFQVNTAETSDFLSFQKSSHKTRLDLPSDVVVLQLYANHRGPLHELTQINLRNNRSSFFFLNRCSNKLLYSGLNHFAFLEIWKSWFFCKHGVNISFNMKQTPDPGKAK